MKININLDLVLLADLCNRLHDVVAMNHTHVFYLSFSLKQTVCIDRKGKKGEHPSTQKPNPAPRDGVTN